MAVTFGRCGCACVDFACEIFSINSPRTAHKTIMLSVLSGIFAGCGVGGWDEVERGGGGVERSRAGMG